MITQLADLWENVRVALDGLVANKLRSALTMLGIIIGVGAVIALLSIGNGASASITDQISSMGTNLLMVSSFSFGRAGGGGGSLGLTMDDVEALSDLNNVSGAEMVVPQYDGRGQLIYGDVDLSATVSGVTPNYQALYDFALEEGQFIDADEVDRRSKVVVLGSNIAEELFGDFSPVGQTIKVANTSGTRVSLDVIGVIESQGDSMVNNVDDSIFVPLSTAQSMLFNARNAVGDLQVSRINITAKSEELVDATEAQVDATLREQHGLAEEEDADFRIMNQASLLDTMTDVTGTMTVFLGAIAGISLLVGGIGIMNIMLVSVTERTREIGLRKAVGARKGDILLQFLMEAMILSLLGGALGILLGAGLAYIVNFTGTFVAVVTPGSILLAVSFSLITGLFFGIYPANEAAKLNPIEALRYE
jgi:putative ABC transport system permease protein